MKLEINEKGLAVRLSLKNYFYILSVEYKRHNEQISLPIEKTKGEITWELFNLLDDLVREYDEALFSALKARKCFTGMLNKIDYETERRAI